MSTTTIDDETLAKLAVSYLAENPHMTETKARRYALERMREIANVKDRYEHYKARCIELGVVV